MFGAHWLSSVHVSSVLRIDAERSSEAIVATVAAKEVVEKSDAVVAGGKRVGEVVDDDMADEINAELR